MAPRKKSPTLPTPRDIATMESQPFSLGRYKGEMTGDLPHGRGSYIQKDEAHDTIITYSGEWKEGKKHGSGTESILSTHIPGVRYIGEWADDEKNGIGKEENIAPNIIYEGYHGEWKDGKKHGLGYMKVGLQQVLAGEFEGDILKHGQIIEPGKTEETIVAGKKVWDLGSYIPDRLKCYMPFTKSSLIDSAREKYEKAREKYRFD